MLFTFVVQFAISILSYCCWHPEIIAVGLCICVCSYFRLIRFQQHFVLMPYFACRGIVLSATIHVDQVAIEFSNGHIFLALVDLLECNSSGRHMVDPSA